MKRFTKVRRILALSLVLAMAFGGTVFASDSNTVLVNATYQQLASRGTYTCIRTFPFRAVGLCM